MLLVTSLFSCRDDYGIDGARIHGEKMGAKKCACSKASPQEGMKCIKELLEMGKNHKAFQETAREGGSNMAELGKIFNAARQKALSACK